MKKLLIVLPLFAFFLFSCEPSDVDLTLPMTDTTLFVSGNSVLFPAGTKAIDVYNTITSLFSNTEWHDVNGEWYYIHTEINDGLITQTWQSVPFTKIRYTIITNELFPAGAGIKYTHIVSMFTDEILIYSIEYHWKTFNGNKQKIELKNDPIIGDIIFTF